MYQALELNLGGGKGGEGAMPEEHMWRATGCEADLLVRELLTFVHIVPKISFVWELQHASVFCFQRHPVRTQRDIVVGAKVKKNARNQTLGMRRGRKEGEGTGKAGSGETKCGSIGSRC